jgi:hypothetical protein
MIKIFTVSGDLVAELKSSDPVNESNRSSQTVGVRLYPATIGNRTMTTR